MTYVPDSHRVTDYEAGDDREYRKVWRSALVRLMKDAQGEVHPLPTPDARDAALRFVFDERSEDDFTRFCDCADVRPETVRRVLKDQPPPTLLRERLLDANHGVAIMEMGLPAHEVVEEIKSLQDEGYTFRRFNVQGEPRYLYEPPGTKAKPPPKRKPFRRRQPQQHSVPGHAKEEADRIILSGRPFDAGRSGNYLRARIEWWRAKGHTIRSLGQRMFILENPLSHEENIP